MGQSGRDVSGANEWVVDPAVRELRVNGVPVPIGSRAFEIGGRW